MGVLIDGQWRDGELSHEIGQSGQFNRADSEFRERISADGSSASRPNRGGITSTSRMAARGRIAR